jgi:hypothetical protein
MPRFERDMWVLPFGKLRAGMTAFLPSTAMAK